MLSALRIGGQPFKLVFDTGSSDLVCENIRVECVHNAEDLLQWVVSAACADDDCQRVPTYNSTSSLVQTQTPFSLDYLVGSVNGTVVYETIKLGRYQIASQVLGKTLSCGMLASVN
jgi:hypothetical protein